MDIKLPLSNRMQLASCFSGVGVEIGVEMGKFSEAILKLGKVAHLYSIDPWIPIPGFYTAEAAELAFRTTAARLLRFSPRNTILREDAREAVHRFPDESLDFVYIDSSHEFEETCEELAAWWPKLKKDGWLSGHDYANGEGVRRAVDAFAFHHQLALETTIKDDDLDFPFLITSWFCRKP
jgi:hypothetical protein